MMTTGKFISCLCLLLGLLAQVAAAETPREPIGYLVELVKDAQDSAADPAQQDDDADDDAEAYIIRGEQRLEYQEGSPVYPGDRIETGEGLGIGIVFLDSCAVTLRPCSKLKIEDYAYPSHEVPTHLKLDSGRAFFSVSPRPADARFFVGTELGSVEVKGTKFEIFAAPSGTSYQTSISVIQGTVTVQPNGQNAVDVLNDSQLVLNIATQNITGFNGQTIQLTKGNIPKDQLKTIRENAIVDVQVSVGKKHDIKIKSFNKNPDGSISSIRLTEIDGVTVQSTVQVKDGKIMIYKETERGGKKSVSQIEGGLSIKQKISGATGTVTIRDKALKTSYKGTYTKLDNGVEVSDTFSTKTKVRLVVTRQVLPDGTIIKMTTTFAPGATSGTQITEIIKRDGSRTKFTEIVLTELLPTGDFANVSGPTGASAAPPLPQGAPAIITGGSNVIIPDTSPVSP